MVQVCASRCLFDLHVPFKTQLPHACFFCHAALSRSPTHPRVLTRPLSQEVREADKKEYLYNKPTRTGMYIIRLGFLPLVRSRAEPTPRLEGQLAYNVNFLPAPARPRRSPRSPHTHTPYAYYTFNKPNGVMRARHSFYGKSSARLRPTSSPPPDPPLLPPQFLRQSGGPASGPPPARLRPASGPPQFLRGLSRRHRSPAQMLHHLTDRPPEGNGAKEKGWDSQPPAKSLVS